MNTKKYYFLPFLDNLLAVFVSLLFTMFFGSWFQNKIFGIAMGVVMTLVMCGFIYSRMWKLSRKNTRYGYGLKPSDGVKFVLPLAIFSLALILFFFLAQTNVIPLMDAVLKTYYTFPDNLPRVPVHITPFDYLTVFVRFWFSYLLGFSQETHVWLLLISPVLMLLSGALGFKLGAENKEVLEGYAKASDKLKKKFNE